MEILSLCLSIIAIIIVLLTNNNTQRAYPEFDEMLFEFVVNNEKLEEIKEVMKDKGTIVSKYDKINEILSK